MRRRLVTVAALLGAALVGAVAAIALVGGPSATAAPGPMRTSTATVVRTDLSETELTEGTAGFAPTAPVVNHLSGTYTWLPDPGATIEAGGTLYRVDDAPVVLMTGPTPAWRPFAPGMTDGTDVKELQTNLAALGDAHGLFSSASGTYDGATVAAVDRWQTSTGQPVTGQVALGQIVFLPAAVRVGALLVALGQPASPGASPIQVTTTTRVVSVPLNPNLPTVHVGETVSIVLPDQRTEPGTVSAVGPPPPGDAPGSSQSSGGGGGSGAPTVTAVATVTPDHPAATGTADGTPVQVSLTIQSVQGVMAVPIQALLALSEGGYGLEVVEPSGAHHLVGVTTGVFTGTRVEVNGDGIAPGTKVVVAQ